MSDNVIYWLQDRFMDLIINYVWVLPVIGVASLAIMWRRYHQ